MRNIIYELSFPRSQRMLVKVQVILVDLYLRQVLDLQQKVLNLPLRLCFMAIFKVKLRQAADSLVNGSYLPS